MSETCFLSVVWYIAMHRLAMGCTGITCNASEDTIHTLKPVDACQSTDLLFNLVRIFINVNQIDTIYGETGFTAACLHWVAERELHLRCSAVQETQAFD